VEINFYVLINYKLYISVRLITHENSAAMLASNTMADEDPDLIIFKFGNFLIFLYIWPYMLKNEENII
jgi:hypothetical protein